MCQSPRGQMNSQADHLQPLLQQDRSSAEGCSSQEQTLPTYSQPVHLGTIEAQPQGLLAVAARNDGPAVASCTCSGECKSVADGYEGQLAEGLLVGTHKGPDSSGGGEDPWNGKAGNGSDSSRLSCGKLTSRERWVTLLWVNIALMLERVDEQMLPAMYSFIGAAFNARPSQLATISACQSAMQAIAAPFAGALAQQWSRPAIIAVGCGLWAISAAAFGVCTSLGQGMLFWALNGVGIALVMPNGQSLIADVFEPTTRGRAFGVLFLTGACGGVLGSLLATNLGPLTILGIAGWRVVCLLVAAVALIAGGLVWSNATDPRAGRRPPLGPGLMAPLREMWDQIASVLVVPSFIILLCHGILGCVAVAAIRFLTLYLQLIGMSDAAASAVVSAFLLGVALGGLTGGFLGDAAARRFPLHGRICVAQTSIALGMPLAVLFLKGLPRSGSPSSVAAHLVTAFTWGFAKKWFMPACNAPLLAEVSPERARSMVYAFGRTTEIAVGTLSQPLIGLAAEKIFGFHGAATRSHDRAVDLQRAGALSSAILMGMLVPRFLDQLLYIVLHFTYPRDKQRALEADDVMAMAAAVDAYTEA